MAPSHTRQLLVITLPTIVFLFSWLWYKKKKIGTGSDTGDTKTQETEKSQLELAKVDNLSPEKSSSTRNFSRSLSGVDSAPIDIIIPPELRSVKSHPIVISDEDLDLEIEKIKSMRNNTLSRSKSDYTLPLPNPVAKTPSPLKDSSQKDQETLVEEITEMAQNDVAVIEEKLTSLKVNSKKQTSRKRERKNSNNNKKEHNEFQRQSNEGDSANHSPSDVMLATSLGSIFDTRSERSSDSGKGGSDLATPPKAQTPVMVVPEEDDHLPILYEFVIPQTLVGKLIGRQGYFVTQIKNKSNANIVVKKHPLDVKLKVCSIEGTRSEIDKALKLIRMKFPTKKHPEVTLEQVHFAPLPLPTFQLIPEHTCLKLVEGINNDTVLSCLVAPNHLFLQLPTHPSFPSLNILNDYMNRWYTEKESPMIPFPLHEPVLCVAYSVNTWLRAVILSTDEETETSYVKFVDCGGYACLENSKLRQIKAEFITLPFQATECYLANVRLLNEDKTWPQEAYELVANLTKGAIIYTQIADYTQHDIPLVYCFVATGNQLIFLNRHLVDKGYAEWVSEEEIEKLVVGAREDVIA